MSGSLRVAIVGATGLVGEALLRVLDARRFPVASLAFFAGARSSGSKLQALGAHHDVLEVDERTPDFSAIDLVFFAAGAEVSRMLAPRAAAAGTLVIDKSSAFRLDDGVPLIVPEINANAIGDKRLIANPNCAVIPLSVMLGPIHRQFGLAWVSVSTYQSVSGAGKEALLEFESQLAGERMPERVLPRRIANNVFPENGPFDDSGYGEEERKIAAEFQKILDDETIRISATSVRVPVVVGHGEAVAFATRQPASIEDIERILRSAPGVRFLPGTAYATPIEVTGSDDVIVGRLRPDTAHPGAYLAWLVCDNLRKGAATNAVQIAEAAYAAQATRGLDVGAKA
ncbi:MAG: aspartate-semialdehyde dehydrogenase [Candidatus Eremiobacteraeota bacterium]|nr:aspartate-semialdehyde dehydrogenase [Candidatus Eremiobacteraeota bacterium]